MLARLRLRPNVRAEIDPMKVTVILSGRGGELDRVIFTPKNAEHWTTTEMAEAIDEVNGGPWVLGDGDTITITED